jgi:hypothetical protein
MHGGPYIPKPVPGVMGALGEDIGLPPGGTITNPQARPAYAMGRRNEAEAAARESFASALPPQIAGQVLFKDDARKGVGLLQSGIPANGISQAGGPLPPGGGIVRAGFMAPDAAIQRTGGPGDLGGPGGLAALPGPVPPAGLNAPGVVAAVGAIKDGQGNFSAQRTSVRFAGPNGMKVTWYVPGEDGKPQLAPTSLEVPGRYNFTQAAIYRLKLSNIPGRPGLELYPTLEVVPSNNRTSTFLAHSSVPLVFTQEDFDQVASGNYLVKVVYLPNPQFQDLAVTGPNEIVSSRLEPGADPIAEALSRGSILLVVRLGNIDLEAPNTPALDAPSPYQQKAPPICPPMGMGGPGMMGPPPGMAGMMPPPGMGGMMQPPPGMAGMMPPPGLGGMPPPGAGGPGAPGAMRGPGLPPGGPMIPGMFPPPGMMPPGAPPAGAGGPVGKKSVNAAIQPVSFEEEPPAKEKKPSDSWMPSFFGRKAK